MYLYIARVCSRQVNALLFSVVKLVAKLVYALSAHTILQYLTQTHLKERCEHSVSLCFSVSVFFF